MFATYRAFPRQGKSGERGLLLPPEQTQTACSDSSANRNDVAKDGHELWQIYEDLGARLRHEPVTDRLVDRDQDLAGDIESVRQ
jgi:hypothetical protein